MRGPGDMGVPEDGAVEPVDADSAVPWYLERLEPAVELAAARGYTGTELRRLERIARTRREELFRRWQAECRKVTG